MNSQKELVECIRSTANRANRLATLFARELAVEVHAETVGVVEWVSRMMSPAMSSERQVPQRKWTLIGVHADDVVKNIVECIESADSLSTDSQRRHAFSSMHVGDGIRLDHYAELGSAWLTDLESATSTFVYSSRTILPMVELYHGCVEILSAHLRGDGWYVFHAGGVEIDGRGMMIVGDSGSGKTSLVLGLVSQGAGYIGNERIFVKPTTSSIEVHPFPQAAAIGIGTATELTAMRHLVERPDSIGYPQFRYNVENVARTSPELRAALPDKLLVPAADVIELLGGRYGTTAAVDGVLFPQIDIQGDVSVDEMPSQSANEILRRNRIPSKHDLAYPVWLPLPFGHDPGSSSFPLGRLAGLPQHLVRFPFREDQLPNICESILGSQREHI